MTVCLWPVRELLLSARNAPEACRVPQLGDACGTSPIIFISTMTLLRENR